MLLVKFKFNKKNRMKANKAKADIKGYSNKIEMFFFMFILLQADSGVVDAEERLCLPADSG